MPVCRYYSQQGYCRNGNNCGFDHVRSHRGYEQNNDKSYNRQYDAYSPNRTWVNPQVRQTENYHDSRYYDNSHRDNNYYKENIYSRGRQHQHENQYVAQSGSSSSFSFTKTLQSVQRPDSSNSVFGQTSGQSSIQQRVNQTNTPAPSGSFSFVKALHQNVSSEPQDDSLYSKLEHLTEKDKSQFLASQFTCGRVPLLPPTVEFC